jgi:hypothetical protein
MARKIGKAKRKTYRVTVSPRETRLLKYLAQGMSITDAGRKAGYADHGYVGQIASQALRNLRTKMPDKLNMHGLTDDAAIENYLKPALEAMETKFFPYLIGRGRNRKQKMTRRDVIAWTPRIQGLDMLFRLKGSYAPKTLEEEEARKSSGVHVIVVDVPRPHRPQLIPAIDIPGNGDEPKK